MASGSDCSLQALLCVRRAGERARGGPGPGPRARLPAPLQGERPGAAARVAGTPSWAARCGARAATGGPAGGPRGAGRAAPRPPRPPLASVRLPARTRTHPRAVSTFFSEKSEVRSERWLGEPPAPPGSPKPAGPPHRACPAAPGVGAPRGQPGVCADLCCWRGCSSFFSKMKGGTVVFAASPGLLLPPPPPLHCTFKWKIFRSQQKHCVQKRLSRSYHQTLEETLPGKLPFGRKYWRICLFIGREMIPRRGENQGAFLVFVRSSNICFVLKSRGPL